MRALLRFRARNLEIHRSFRKRPEEIFVRKESADDAEAQSTAPDARLSEPVNRASANGASLNCFGLSQRPTLSDTQARGASFTKSGAYAGDDIKKRAMTISLQTEVRMVKGVGPQRAELLAKRGIYTLEDLLNYLPFRYEDRIHFSKIKDVQPNGIYTLRARVMSGQAVRGMYGRDAIYHLLVQDDTGSLPCKFFHGGYPRRPLEARAGTHPPRQSRNR